MYGPAPTYNITFVSSGLPLGLYQELPTGPSGEINIHITIPQSALNVNTTLGQAGFDLYYSLYGGQDGNQLVYSLNGEYGYNAIAQFGQQIGFYSNTYAYNYTQNNNCNGFCSLSPTTHPSIFIFDNAYPNHESYDSIYQQWNVDIFGYMNSTVRTGAWQFNLFVRGNNNNDVGFGYQSYQSANSPYRQLYVGVPADTTFFGCDGYVTSINSMTSSPLPLQVVNHNTPFWMYLNVPVQNGLDYAVVKINLPASYSTYSNPTFQQNFFRNGWIYNTTSQSYDYNPNATISYITSGIQENPYNYFNKYVQDPYGYSEPLQLLVYIFPNNSTYQAHIGYTYYNQSIYQDAIVITNSTAPDIFGYNGTIINNITLDHTSGSSYYNVALNLTMTDSIPTGSQLNYDVYARDTLGNIIYQAYDPLNPTFSPQQIDVDSPVATTKIFTSAGEVTNDVLHVKTGDSIVVQSTLMGYSNPANLQAASFQLYGYDYQTTPTVSIYSDLAIIVRYDWNTHSSSISGYNNTYQYFINGTDTSSTSSLPPNIVNLNNISFVYFNNNNTIFFTATITINSNTLQLSYNPSVNLEQYNNGQFSWQNSTVSYINYNGMPLYVNNNSTYATVTFINGTIYSSPIIGSNITIGLNSYQMYASVTYIYTNFTTIDPSAGYYTIDYSIANKITLNSLIVGTPHNNMWGTNLFTINPANGAVDLDGNLATTNDQFFVKSTFDSTTYWSYKQSHMYTSIFWDPNTNTSNNEYNLYAYMGYNTVNFSWEWNQTYYWYYASNMSLISPSTYQMINNTLFSNGQAAPEY